MPTELKQQYWQWLPFRVAYEDGMGNAWLATEQDEHGNDRVIEESYRRDLKVMSSREVLVLGDRRGRLWLTKRHPRRARPGEPVSRCYDGKAWQPLPFLALQGFEDSAGRVFLVGEQAFHVLHDGRWSEQQHSAAPSESSWRFVEDNAGRAWLWVAWMGGELPPPGAWRYDGGRWTHHTAENGLPGERVFDIVPLDGRRMLLKSGAGWRGSTYAIGSWPRQKDDKIIDDPAHEILPGIPLRDLFYRGYDKKGNHFFSARGKIVYITREGAAHLVENRPEEFSAKTARGLGIGFGGASFSPRGDQRFCFTEQFVKPETRELPPMVPRDAQVYLVDTLGRIYFAIRRHPVQVIWPEHEKPGDVIRARYHPAVPEPTLHAHATGHAFQDTSGDIWFNAQTGFSRALARLLRWTGQGWEDTGVQQRPHPPLALHPRPPWRGFPHDLRHICGKNGAVLVVAFMDVYQQEAAQRAREAGEPLCWPEGWLRKEGKWIGPLKVEELIKEHFDTLVRDFTLQTTDLGHFDLQSDGKHVWVAYGTQVAAFTSGTERATWTIPSTPRWSEDLTMGHQAPFRLVNLICTPGGETLCFYRDSTDRVDPSRRKDCLLAAKLAVVEDGIKPSQLPGAALEDSGNSRAMGAVQIHRAQHGQLWAWRRSRSHTEWTALWNGQSWQKQEKLSRFLMEDPEGGLWFNHHHDTGLETYAVIVNGVRRELALPPPLFHWAAGGIRAVGPNRYLGCSAQYITDIEHDGRNGQRDWSVKRIHLLTGAKETESVFLDGKGNIVGSTGWTAPFPLTRE